ncbi:DUF922 domain-containing protein [Ichthyenterobacterium sp. W332]|uniref:DUF922 domain-containing protein n=1 Tax=Microcosmobacter mediterraneus TaxID=3075607 RepID=A0ABU2YFU9_9FLAO|nr:DUF922 domain-containing protein [Ichthyenterobacterium sp. W332]MDT0557059.1 DUF922 domain-containing protein [Ichthyenterobacterium sp. W332]
MISLKHVSVLLCFVMLLGNTEPETISWQSSRKLTWSDFKAKPVTGTSAVALTASGITFGYSVETRGDDIITFETHVFSHFYPEKSWVIKEDANDHILGHEQLHFDITELYVRKFREGISKLQVSNNIKSQLAELHKLVNEKLNETQKKYDAQSNHSINKEAQKQWEIFIDVELKNLEHFASR